MKSSYSHKCAVPNCTREIPDGLLMCSAHWARVPNHLQVAVNRTYRRGSAKAYLEARKAAILSVSPPQTPVGTTSTSSHSEKTSL
jgi:hypothetical protein